MLFLRQVHMKIWILLIGLLITNISSFMILPFLSLYMNSKLEFSASIVGVVLMVNVICQRGLTFFGGMLSDHFGTRKLLIIGLFIRFSGYLIYSFAFNVSILVLAAALVGLGGALYDPGLMATIAKLAGENRAQVFALRSTVINIGAGIGPILGGILYNTSFFWVFVVTALTHLIFLLFVFFLGPKDLSPKSNPGIFRYFKVVLKSRELLLLAILNCIFWFLYSQLNLTIPLFAKDKFHVDSMIGTLFTINGVLAVILQYGLTKMAFKKWSGTFILSLGLIFMAAAYLILTIIPNYIVLYVFILLFTVSEIFVFPTLDNMVAEIAPSSYLSTYYGFVDVGWAVGAMLGNLLGGIIFEFLGRSNMYWLAWLVYTLLALFSIEIVYLISRKRKEAIRNCSETTSS